MFYHIGAPKERR